jgi:hypothetical protein
VNHTYINFCALKREQALFPVYERLLGSVIKNVEIKHGSVTFTVDDGDVIEFVPDGDDGDPGLDVYLNGKRIEDYFGVAFDKEFIGPKKPPMTAEQREAYRQTLSPFERCMYDEMSKVLNDTRFLMLRQTYGGR